ncbi:MAG: glucosamine-6-phosphate deaminase [Acidobacteriaceae bacterium]|nr:glucosamine-6-phosphate deaminase [Acidobacteriaceae bacterium]
MPTITTEKLNLHIFKTPQELGAAAARHAADRMRSLAQKYEIVPVVFATGNSQLETLRALVQMPDIPWEKIIGFHLDEYIGISDQHPASFRRYLREELASRVPIREFYYLEGDSPDPNETCLQYAGLLREYDPQLCLIGIGENGHLAFNDPPVADFSDPTDVKIVTLDEACRRQQVAEGWFPSFADVPETAISLTIACLFRIPELIASVPGERKRVVVRRTMEEPISTDCPSTILRTHPNVHVYLDANSYPQVTC